MAKKPNYDFDRRERERLKREKNAARAEEKKAGQTPADPTHPEDQAPSPVKD